MEPVDCAYAAGILEGEGCISLIRPKRQHPFFEVTVTSTDREVLDWMKMRWRGHIQKLPKREEHHRQAWAWRVKGASGAAFLLCVRPYMVMHRKISRAELALAYHATTNRGGNYSPEDLQRRAALLESFA